MISSAAFCAFSLASFAVVCRSATSLHMAPSRFSSEACSSSSAVCSFSNCFAVCSLSSVRRVCISCMSCFIPFWNKTVPTSNRQTPTAAPMIQSGAAAAANSPAAKKKPAAASSEIVSIFHCSFDLLVSHFRVLLYLFRHNIFQVIVQRSSKCTYSVNRAVPILCLC